MEESKIDLLQKKEKKPGKIKRLFFGLGKFSVYVLIILGILISSFSYQIVFSSEQSMPGLEKLSFFGKLKHLSINKEKALRGENSDQINLLLLGMGGIGHEGPFLTDTIIFTSIRPSDKGVSMVSIPRDLAVPIPDQGWRKINHINSFGELKESGSGGAFASEVIGDLFGIPTPYYVRIDFKGFEKLIDDLGGLKINVENSFADSQYPTDDYKVQTVSFEKGWQTMDGKTALTYVRSRHGNNGEGSDFARARRQQKVIAAFKEKVFSFSTLINPKNIVNILSAFSDSIKTDLELWEIIKLAQMAKEIDTDQIIHTVLDDGPGGYLKPANYDGAYVLEPVTGDFDAIRNLIQNVFNQGPEEKIQIAQNNIVNKIEKTEEEEEEEEEEIVEEEIVEENEIEEIIEEEIIENIETATIEVLNGTWYNGLAGSTAKELKADGYSIFKIANAPTQDYEKTIIFTLKNDKPEALAYLQKNFNATFLNTPPEWLGDENSTEDFDHQADFIIVLGKNNIPE